jgi:hypothetical protein
MEDATTPFWKIDGEKLLGSNGEVLDIWPEPFWYLAPSRTKYERGEGRVRPLEFASVLHNASIGHGLVTSLEVLLSGIEPKPNKGGAAADAEWLLEDVRANEFPEKPSRLRAYFLNHDRGLAELRARDMFRDARQISLCHLIRNGGRYHFADVGLYEQLEGRPDDRALARRYWSNFVPTDPQQQRRLEVLADSALYFPEWKTFPQLDHDSLLNWMHDNPPPSPANG